ncbi:hypothetical protein E2C01_019164 [Portunus trituberculatus]|uniref:Uncharacterized protein n=1 Tax=Portunus trituberculatus TaxID=210409 RepID=A0A5B7DXI8_PORTR|nr:hypothetical protein [Portunus trituberculatus]
MSRMGRATDSITGLTVSIRCPKHFLSWWSGREKFRAPYLSPVFRFTPHGLPCVDRLLVVSWRGLEAGVTVLGLNSDHENQL